MEKLCIITSSVFTHGGEQRVATLIANQFSDLYNVTIITHDNRKLSERNIYNLKPNIKIIYVTSYKYNLQQRMAKKLSKLCNLYNCEYLYPFLNRIFYPNKYIGGWVKLMRDEDYDVVIALSGLSILLGFLSRHIRAVTIGWEHNSYEAYFKTPRRYFWRMDLLFRDKVGELDGCVVLNEIIKEKYMKNFNIPCKVIYNPKSFSSVEKSNLKNKRFVSCGRFVTQKGFDLLIDSFRDFCSEREDWELILVGDGELKKAIEERIAKYGLNDKVVLTGYTNDVKDILLSSSIYLLTSRWEGFPMVLTEAMEVGLPIICYDISAVTPLVTNGKEGVVVPAFNTKMFAEAMVCLANSEERRKEMSINIVAKAQSLSIENIMDEWKNYLEGFDGKYIDIVNVKDK